MLRSHTLRARGGRKSVISPLRRARPLRRGFSLIELAISMAIFSVILAGVMSLYESDVNQSRGNSTTVELMMVVGVIQQTYGNDPASIDKADASVLAQSGLLPQKWVANNNEGLVSPWGTPLTIAGDASWEGVPDISIMLTGIPRSQCIGLVTADYGEQVLDVTSFTGIHASGRPMNAAEANEACPDATDTFWFGVVP